MSLLSDGEVAGPVAAADGRIAGEGAREVERALVVSTESLDLATRIGADRCVALVRDLAPAFKPYQKVDGVPAFLERLRTA
ncbi:hypothetical protein [Streptomyces cyaneofuscatus]|uniref:hypothetical protein n=1 Tax=Streptomyces cyaneofuscatus TaxID=66883 RepID=UPI0033A544E2